MVNFKNQGDTMNIIVCGDTHGYWSILNRLINKKKPDIILQCGDFGYWPGLKTHSSDGTCKYILYNEDGYIIKPHNTKIYWCDGNHENHWKLKELREKNISEVVPNVFYMKRGSILTLPDGRNVLFMGGADSIDKNLRTIGIDWFPEEIINQKDIYDLPDIKVDIVISHTCPEFLNEFMKSKYVFNEKLIDPSQKALVSVWEKYKPDLWYFGHFHTYITASKYNTKFVGLSCNDNGLKWWINME